MRNKGMDWKEVQEMSKKAETRKLDRRREREEILNRQHDRIRRLNLSLNGMHVSSAGRALILYLERKQVEMSSELINLGEDK